MAFKLTPGIKGNPANNSIMGGGCGGDGQPPCPPRFQAEKNVALVADRSSSSRSKTIKAKKKVAVVAPAPAPAPAPVKLIINIPKGYEFKSKMEKAAFYEKFSDLSGFKSQEELDRTIIKQLGGAIGGPVLSPVPIKPVVGLPIKGGEEAFEAAPVKKANVAIAK